MKSPVYRCIVILLLLYCCMLVAYKRVYRTSTQIQKIEWEGVFGAYTTRRRRVVCVNKQRSNRNNKNNHQVVGVCVFPSIKLSSCVVLFVCVVFQGLKIVGFLSSINPILCRSKISYHRFIQIRSDLRKYLYIWKSIKYNFSALWRNNRCYGAFVALFCCILVQ